MYYFTRHLFYHLGKLCKTTSACLFFFFYFNIERGIVPFEYVLRTHYYKTAWRIWEIAYLAIFNRTILKCKLWFCNKKNRSPAIMWNVAVSPFRNDLMFEYHDSKYIVTATLFCVSFANWTMITESERFGGSCPCPSSQKHPLIAMGELCVRGSGKMDPFLLIPDVRNIKLHEGFETSPNRIVSILCISLISMKLYQEEVWFILRSHYSYQTVWKHARPDTYLLVSLIPF